MFRNFPWTIPNILSLYRLLSFPFVLALVLMDYRQAFVILLSINLVTDILDGFIARTFNQKTEIGSRLDSMADLGTYILAVAGILQFEWPMVQDYGLPLGIFVALYFTGVAITFVRFGRLSGLHNYSFKITGYLQGSFFFVLFNFGFYAWYFWIMIIVGMIAALEDIVILLILPEPRSNVKGLYWVLKDLREKRQI